MTENKSKILVISTMYPGKTNHSFGVFVKNQVEALKERGLHMDVAAIKDPRTTKKYLLRKYLTWFIQILYFLHVKGRKYDIIHAHYVFPSGYIGLVFKKLFGTRLIVTAHGGDLNKMAKLGSFFFYRTKKVLQEADHIIAVGESLKQEIINEYDINHAKVTLLNMGVNRGVFRPINQSSIRSDLGVAKSSKIILYVGNLIKEKGIMELLDAYKGIKKGDANVELHLIGAPKEPLFYRDLIKKIKREKILDVTFHSPKKQKEIACWMVVADVFVLPSHMEGFGLVALEAMSCHTPVVGSGVGGLKYLLSEGAGVIIKPKDSSSLQEGLIRVIQDQDLRRELITRGEIKAQEYDQEKILDKLISLYG